MGEIEGLLYLVIFGVIVWVVTGAMVEWTKRLFEIFRTNYDTTPINAWLMIMLACCVFCLLGEDFLIFAVFAVMLVLTILYIYGKYDSKHATEMILWNITIAFLIFVIFAVYCMKNNSKSKNDDK